MSIIKELGELKKLLENRNFGYQPAVWALVCVLVEYIKDLEKRIKELNPYDSLPIRKTMDVIKKEKRR